MTKKKKKCLQTILIDSLTIVYYEPHIKCDIEVVSKLIHVTGGIWIRIVLKKA